MRRSGNTIIFVGNLPGDMRRSEVEDLFAKYGHIVDIDLKLPPRPPGFCFIEFEEPVEAADAIKGRNGYEFDGRRLRVEWARGSQRSPPPRREFTAPNNGGGGGSIRRSDYRVVVEGLPSRASWQDLKDHMRRAGDVCFVDVHRSQRGTVGVVEYTNHSDMKYAIRKLHDSEFKNPFGKGFISVREDRRSPRGRSYTPSPRSRSRSYSRSLSPRRSYSRGRSYSRSFSRSPRSRSPRGRSLSPGRSPIRGRNPIGSQSPVRRSRSRSVDSLGDRNGKVKSPVRSRSRSPSVVKDKKVSRSLSRSRSISPLPPRRRSISRSPSRSPKRARYSNSRSRSPP